MIRRWYGLPLGAVILTLLLTACGGRETPPLRWPGVRFCTAEAGAVEGALFYVRAAAEGAAVHGQLIFNDLPGWQTATPVPSVAYGPKRTAGGASVPSFHAYWTGDRRTLCKVAASLMVEGSPDGPLTPDKLRLTYRNPDLGDNVILGAGPTADAAFFTATYDQTELTVSRVEIVERAGLGIQHGIVIHSAFPEAAGAEES